MAKEKSTYIEPSWSAVTEIPYNVEIMKGGVIMEEQQLTSKAYFIIGRDVNADIRAKHSSISRYHCVIQVNGRTGEIFLYDMDSTHGTYLNKRKIESKVYEKLKVGYVFKLGLSERLYVINGPEELLPAEGLNKTMMQKMISIEKEKIKQKKKNEKGMQSICHDVTWGLLLPDTSDPLSSSNNDEDKRNINWKEYSNESILTENQKKYLNKIKKHHIKIENLQKECQRIQLNVKRNEFDITSGQAETLLNNERKIEKLSEELEEFEEVLEESIRDSLNANDKTIEYENKRKRDEMIKEIYKSNENDDDDDFYDRTKYKKNINTKVISLDELKTEKNELEEKKEKLINEKNIIGKKNQSNDDDKDDIEKAIFEIEENQVKKLTYEIKRIEKRVDEINKLMKIADPCGFYEDDINCEK